MKLVPRQRNRREKHQSGGRIEVSAGHNLPDLMVEISAGNASAFNQEYKSRERAEIVNSNTCGHFLIHVHKMLWLGARNHWAPLHPKTCKFRMTPHPVLMSVK